jgi:hypothetical protein
MLSCSVNLLLSAGLMGPGCKSDVSLFFQILSIFVYFFELLLLPSNHCRMLGFVKLTEVHIIMGWVLNSTFYSISILSQSLFDGILSKRITLGNCGNAINLIVLTLPIL